MNKRIQELIVQAGDYVNKTYTGPVPATFAGYLVRYEDEECDKWNLFSEKFAELIVRECIDTAFHKGHPDLEFLLKHFGVKE